jgi:hypothetical protein
VNRHNDDELFGPGDDLADVPDLKVKERRVRGDFYMCPKAWADQASEVSGLYLILALRLYRRWRMREPGADVITATAKGMAGPGYSRTGRRRLITRLEEAGLIEVVARAPGRAVRVRVIDP